VSNELSRSKYCFLRAEPSTSACTEHDPPLPFEGKKGKRRSACQMGRHAEQSTEATNQQFVI